MKKVRLSEIHTFARDILEKVPKEKERATLVTLSGDLGAGKTTLVQALARELGVMEIVQSPTYVLMKSYEIRWKGFTQLIHIDAYRLEKQDEFVALRPEEFFVNKGALVCVEWPEKVEGVLPVPDITIRLSADSPDSGVSGANPDERFIEIV